MKPSLYEYIDIAKKVISKHGVSQMLKDEDAISYVASFMMKYDERYNPAIGSIEGYRSKNGQYGIKKWLLRKKNKDISLDFEYGDSNLHSQIPSTENTLNNVYFNEVLNEIEKLDERKQNCIKLYYFENKTLDDISQIYLLTKERIRQIIKSALEEVRLKFV